MATLWGSSGSGESCNDSYTTEQKNTIFSAMGGTALVSFSLCVVAMMFVLCFKLHKKFVYRLALYQVFSSMLVSLAVMLATVPIYIHDLIPYTTICTAGGYILEYLMWVKLLFAFFLLFHIFCLAAFLKNLMKLEVYYVLLSFLIPLLFTWIPFIHTSYGSTESWCWIRAHSSCDPTQRYWEGFIEQFALWYGPLSICIFVSIPAIIVILVAFKYRYNRLSPSESDPLLEECMKRYMLKVYFRKLIPLLIYPIIFFALFLFPIFRQVHHAISPPNFTLSLIHSVCYASVGLFSSIVLILHVLLVRRLKSWNEYFFHKNTETYDPTISLAENPNMVYDDRIGAFIITGPRGSSLINNI